MTNKEIELQIGNLKSTQDITNTYQQVAAIRMRKIKNTVVQNRKFFDSLSQVYMQTQRFYSKRMAMGGAYAPKYIQKGNGKSVCVLISANTGLYGSVIKDVFDLFTKETQGKDVDLVVTGRLGRNWMQAQKNSKPFKYIDLPDGTDSLDAGIKAIFDYIAPYSDITVYHGLFKNIVEQPPKTTKVTQKLDVKGAEGTEIESFLFEPTIEKVLGSFEEQLVYSFFDQSIYEASLAKFGSRMINLDSATQNISKSLGVAQMAFTKMKHRKQNRRQMELVSVINLGT